MFSTDILYLDQFSRLWYSLQCRGGHFIFGLIHFVDRENMQFKVFFCIVK